MGFESHAPGASPILQEDMWTSGSVWTFKENLAPTRVRTTDCPAHSESELPMLI